MIELLNGIWVRPEEVQALWESGENIVIKFRGSDHQLFTNKERQTVPELVARLNATSPQWEQPSSTTDDIQDVDQ